MSGEPYRMRELIEGTFPLQEINQLAMTEKITKGHPGNIHLWWNRSPIASSTELLKDVIGSDLSGAKVSSNDTPPVTIVDPFCGSGCLTLSATGTGLPIIAGDINSVAALITKAVAEIPSCFRDTSPVSKEAAIRLFTGSEGIAEDIRCYGKWIRQQLCNKLASYYPGGIAPDENGKQVYSWIWTRTAPCPNPACGCQMPLVSSYVLSRLKGREYHVVPRCAGNRVEFMVLPGAPETASTGNKIGKQGAQFQCPKCGSITKDDYIKQVGRAGKLDIQLMAVGFVSDAGRTFDAPDERQEQAAHLPCCSDLPVGELPDNPRWFSPPLFGIKEYVDLYTPRQLALLTALCDLISKAQRLCREDALAAGFSDDETPLDKGGSGALAYSQGIGLYLSLVLGKLANYQSEICTWDNRTANMRAAFTRQAIPMTWTFAEGNPFSSVTGNYDAMLSDVVSSVQKLSASSSVRVVRSDALQFPFPHDSLLFTELPYYDNVGYAELSDYFYIWLRRCLKSTFSGLFDQLLSSKDDLSSVPEHFGGDSQLAKEHYETGIRQFFKNYRNFATHKSSSVVFFEYGKQDEASMANRSGQSDLSHWENLIDALVQAGFQIDSTLPVRTEMPNESYETCRVAVLFRPRNENAPATIRRAVVAELKRELPKYYCELSEKEVEKWDRPIIGMGFGLSVFSKYGHVLNADGSKMDVRDALQVIWTEITECIAGIDNAVDNY